MKTVRAPLTLPVPPSVGLFQRWDIALGAVSVALLAALVAPCLAAVAPPAPGDLYRSSYRIIDVHTHGVLPTESALQAHFEVMEATGVDAFTLLLYDGTGWPNVGGWSKS
ncbi:MAG: hypothetical protein RIQ93_2440, partial [Verrucomicrobiota bacterium]